MNQRQLSDIDNSRDFLPLPLHYRYRVRWVPDYIDKVSNWADRWYVDFYKSKYLLISSKTGENRDVLERIKYALCTPYALEQNHLNSHPSIINNYFVLSTSFCEKYCHYYTTFY